MNILFVSKSNIASTLQRGRQVELPKKLSELNNKVNLITALYSYDPVNVEYGFYDQVYPIKIGNSPFLMSVIYFWKLLFKLIKYLFIDMKNTDFVILDYPSVIPSLPVLFILHQINNKCKFILDIRTIPVEIKGITGILKKIEYYEAIWLAKHFFDGLTVITNQLREDIVNRYDINSDSIGVWTSGVTLETFDPSIAVIPKSIEEFRGKFIIMHHGIMGHNRGLQEAVDSILILRDELPDILLFLLGDGPAKADLKSQIDINHLHNNVYIHDPVPYTEVKDYLSAADIGLLSFPNLDWWRVSSPQKLMEYLSMEKPVIVTDIPAFRDVLSDEECAFYITTNAPSEIAQSIRAVYYCKDELKRLGKSGRKIIEHGFTWDLQAANLLNYLVKVKQKKITLKSGSNL